MKTIEEVNERGFGDILDFMNAGVYITDTDRRIVFWNKMAEKITGYRAEDVVGRRCRDNILMHVNQHGQRLCTTDLCPLHHSMVHDKPSDAPVIVYAKTNSGDRIPLSTSVAPVRDDSGQVIGGVEVFRDEREGLREMELAQTVQRQMITEVPPEDDRLRFDVQYAPRELIGGDFCHIRRLSPDELVVFVGDAAGHGPPAALYSALTYSLIMECQDMLSDPAGLMAAMNIRACKRASGLGFFTAVCATIDAAELSLKYCAAGHPPPFLQHPGERQLELLSLSHLPVGTYDEATYENTTVQLATGDRLLLYTDGATDIRTGPEERLNIDGLAKLVAEQSPELSLSFMLETLLELSVEVEPDDDITLVSCLIL